MKIGLKTPSLPSFPDVTKTPAAPAPIPIPYPNVAGASSFASGSGVERRYSVQFLKGLESRLQLAGMSSDFAAGLKQRMSTLDRSGVDREGRVVDSLLAGAHPKEALRLYELTSKLSALVTPGGVRAEANRFGSWTVRPPEGEPIELKPGSSLQLPGGVTLKATPEQLEASGSFAEKLAAHGAEVAKVLDPATMAVALGLTTGLSVIESGLELGISVATWAVSSDLKKEMKLTAELQHELARLDAAIGSLMTELQHLQQQDAKSDRRDSSPQHQAVMESLGAVANSLAAMRGATSEDAIGDAVGKLAGNAKRMFASIDGYVSSVTTISRGAIDEGAAKVEQTLAKTLPLAVSFLAKLAGLAGVSEKLQVTLETMEQRISGAIATLMSAAQPVREQLLTTLGRAGHSAAPSRRADPAMEKAVLLNEIAMRRQELAGHAAQEAVDQIKQVADRARGQARDVVQGLFR